MKSFKLRSVIEIKKKKRDISHEPEMIRLKEIFKGMSEHEQSRTVNHLEKEKEG